MSANFEAFFRQATATVSHPAGNAPYDYQRRLAGGDTGRSCESQLISISARLGKTAA